MVAEDATDGDGALSLDASVEVDGRPLVSYEGRPGSSEGLPGSNDGLPGSSEGWGCVTSGLKEEIEGREGGEGGAPPWKD
jgi:hypothetical protein